VLLLCQNGSARAILGFNGIRCSSHAMKFLELSIIWMIVLKSHETIVQLIEITVKKR